LGGGGGGARLGCGSARVWWQAEQERAVREELVCDKSACGEQDRKVAAAKMLQNGWRAYHEQKAKKPKPYAEEGGVPENSILNEPLFYKAALQYAQMRAESVNGLPPAHTLAPALAA